MVPIEVYLFISVLLASEILLGVVFCFFKLLYPQVFYTFCLGNIEDEEYDDVTSKRPLSRTKFNRGNKGECLAFGKHSMCTLSGWLWREECELRDDV